MVEDISLDADPDLVGLEADQEETNFYPHSQHNYSRFESSEERKAKIERFVHNK